MQPWEMNWQSSPQQPPPQQAPAEAAMPWQMNWQTQGMEAPDVSEVPTHLRAGAIGGFSQMVGAPRELRDFAEQSVIPAAERYTGYKIPQVVKDATNVGMNTVFPATTMPTTAQHQKFIEQNITGPQPTKADAKTQYGKYAHNVGEFGVGALTGPIGGVRSAVMPIARQIAGNLTKYGVLPAVASEFAGQKAEGTGYESLVRGGVALGVGGVLAAASRPSSAAQAISKNLGNLDDTQLRGIVGQAEALMAEAAQRGVNLSWAQAVEQVAPGTTSLPKFQRYIERTEAGGNAFKPFYEGQPRAMQDAVENTATQIAPPSTAPSTIGPAASQEAQGVLRDVEGAINRSTRPLYNQAAPQILPQAEYAAISGNAPYQEALRQIRQHRELGPMYQNFPDDSLEMVQLVSRHLQRGADTAVTSPHAVDSLLAGARGTASTEAMNTATTASPALARAQAEQAAARQQYLNPLEQGPLGGVARSQNTEGALGAIFPTNPQAGSQGEVSTAITALGRNNPTIPENLVAQHLRNTANKTMAQTQGGENYYGGAKFAKEVAGNPQVERNLLAVTEALPQGQQLRPEVQRLIEVLRATGKRLPEGSQTSTDLIADTAMKSGGLKFGLQRALNLGEDIYQNWRHKNVAGDVSRILMDPEGGEQIIRALHARQRSPAQTILINTLLAPNQHSQ